MNKKVYNGKLDKKLLELVAGFHYVPYKLNKYSKHEVGHMYWNSFLQKKYEVVALHDDGVKVCWDDGNTSITYIPLDIKHDYELKPFEYMGDKVINTRISYTAAEIKALIYTNVITDEEVIDTLIKTYFAATHIPNDYNYYFINTGTIEGESYIKLKRDLKKCPHNFYNIKIVEDLYNDKRIALYEFIDEENNEVIPDKENKVIPLWTPVLSIDHIAGAKYRITLDMYQRDGYTYARWKKLETLVTDDKVYASLTSEFMTRYLFISKNGIEDFSW